MAGAKSALVQRGIFDPPTSGSGHKQRTRPTRTLSPCPHRLWLGARSGSTTHQKEGGRREHRNVLLHFYTTSAASDCLNFSGFGSRGASIPASINICL